MLLPDPRRTRPSGSSSCSPLLLWLGAKQLFASSVGLAPRHGHAGRDDRPVDLRRALGLRRFADGPAGLGRRGARGAGAGAAARPAGQHPLRRRRRARFHLAGSAVPLALMMGIFFTKYVVGVHAGDAPETRATTHAFALGIGTLYGALQRHLRRPRAPPLEAGHPRGPHARATPAAPEFHSTRRSSHMHHRTSTQLDKLARAAPRPSSAGSSMRRSTPPSTSG